MVARPGVKVLGVSLGDDDSWDVSAAGPAFGICPDCGQRTRNRHGWSNRSLQDLPVQGKTVTGKLRLSGWLKDSRVISLEFSTGLCLGLTTSSRRGRVGIDPLDEEIIARIARDTEAGAIRASYLSSAGCGLSAHRRHSSQSSLYRAPEGAANIRFLSFHL